MLPFPNKGPFDKHRFEQNVQKSFRIHKLLLYKVLRCVWRCSQGVSARFCQEIGTPSALGLVINNNIFSLLNNKEQTP